MVWRLFNDGLSDRNIVKRLFEEQMQRKKDFLEAEHIIWYLQNPEKINIELPPQEILSKKMT